MRLLRSVLASTGSALFQPLAALGRSLNPFTTQVGIKKGEDPEPVGESFEESVCHGMGKCVHKFLT